MHICYLSHTADIRGGGERSLVELVAHVRRSGVERITVVGPPGPLAEEMSAIGGVEWKTLPLTILRRSRNPLRLAAFAANYAGGVLRLRSFLARERPSLLHANAGTSALYGALATRGLGVPLIWHMRDIQPREPTFRSVFPRIGRAATAVVAISRAVRDNLISFGVDPEKITVVHNAVRPLALAGREPFRAQWGIGPDDLLLGVVGQILHRKGQMTALRAFARVAQELPRAKLLICGGNEGSDYGRTLAAEAARAGVADRVIFTGFQRDPAPAFDALDILLVPSNQEPFGRVVVEGMFARKPIIATRVGGVPELVRDERDGLLVETGADEEMAEAIRRIALDRVPVASMVESAYGRAHQEFGWDTRTRAIRVLYGRIAGQS